MDPEARAKLDETMTQIARQTGVTLHVNQHPGRTARHVVCATPAMVAAASSRPPSSKTTGHCA